MKIDQKENHCNIYNVDVSALQEGDYAELRRLLYENRIIVLKEQQLSNEAYCAFASQFGDPVPYLQENYHHPEFPLIFVSSNIKRKGEKKIGVARTGGYWHSDTAFEADPKFITMLMPRILPESIPRTTRFIDMSKVYQAVPQNLLSEFEQEDFLHSGRWHYKVRPEDAGLDIRELLEMIDHFAPPVAHPAVITHPYTGEKAIYGTRGFTVGISNKGLDDKERILKELFDLAESGPFTFEIQWSLGDLIIWDNRFLAHSSGRKKAPTETIHQEVEQEEETMMYRITLRDGMPLCASQMKDNVHQHANTVV